MNHKKTCSASFDDVIKRLDKYERALFGEPALKQKGIVEMTSAMYESVMMAKSGEKIFMTLVKISGAIITIGGAFWIVYDLIKRIKIL